MDISKGGFRFPGAFLVGENMARLEAEALAEYTPCRPAPLAQVCRGIAVVHAELLLVHSFREGNGRLARWLADLMAAQAGYPPPLYKFIGRGSKTVKTSYLSAVIRGYTGNYDDLAAFFEEAVSLRLRET